ncbi:unnamed protein product [Albugo candida]|uniref:Uncharacterized protein n=1 Tax=Albugo candida TaxID=65357 RepID=A0A024GF18_9STRA|nr:unnamed protein product [Albugo candida]|eukprot:CCI44902.1 unnamed protein product [Albugo candida]
MERTAPNAFRPIQAFTDSSVRESSRSLCISTADWYMPKYISSLVFFSVAIGVGSSSNSFSIQAQAPTVSIHTPIFLDAYTKHSSIEPALVGLLISSTYSTTSKNVSWAARNTAMNGFNLNAFCKASRTCSSHELASSNTSHDIYSSQNRGIFDSLCSCFDNLTRFHTTTFIYQSTNIVFRDHKCVLWIQI